MSSMRVTRGSSSISSSGGMGIFPFMLKLLLLLLLAGLCHSEEHAHRHAHEATTSAPVAVARLRRNQKRLQQLQQAQDGNDIVFDIGNANANENSNHHHYYHHLRHEQHLRAELAGNGNRQPPLAVKQPTQLELEQLAMLPGPGQQHHVRHHNRHHAAWEQRVFPTTLRHQQHRLVLPEATATATATAIIQTSATATSTPAIWTSTTDAPPLQGLSNSSRYFDREGTYAAWMQPRSTLAPNWQQLDDSYEDDDDDDDEDDDDELDGLGNDEQYGDDVDRAAATELAKQMPRYSLFSQKLPTISSVEQDYDDVDDHSDVQSITNSNRHPSISAGHSKAASKRNVFDWLFKREKEKRKMHSQTQRRVDAAKRTTKTTTTTTTEKPKIFLDDSLIDEFKENNNDNDNANANENNNDENINVFSNEQWNKIEHEHHLKQQKHQRELQALRERNRYTPLIRGGLRRGGNDNEDDENLYNYQPLKSTKLGSTLRMHEHIRQMMRESKCGVPQVRCVRVAHETSKRYSPHCIKLHRCAEDSGCCEERDMVCAPKTTEQVELSFYVLKVDQKTYVEKLPFVNHTKCHCVDQNKYMKNQIFEKPEILKNFRCPSFFEMIVQRNGMVRCDCASGNTACESQKNGKEHFSITDRTNISNGTFKQPTCQFGTYMQTKGCCPNVNGQYMVHNSGFILS